MVKWVQTYEVRVSRACNSPSCGNRRVESDRRVEVRRKLSSSKKLYEPVRLETTQDFVNAISPSAERFDDGGQWIFRGQSRDWPLLPTAYRQDQMPRMGKVAWANWTQRNQARSEFNLIRDFFMTADRAGLAIPEDSYDIRQLLEKISADAEELDKEWPPGRLFSLIALAQHHGVPTRLLGWTYSPWVAAYFAAEEVVRTAWSALQPVEEARSIVVWAFDLGFADLSKLDSDGDQVEESKSGKGFVEVVATPYAGNRNLDAQKGIHLLYRRSTPQTPDDAAWRKPLGQALKQVHATVAENYTALYKFRLPASECASLMRLIAKHGATGATVYPGFDGVARAIWERRNWWPRKG